jgi:hypothetical protein
MNTTQRRQPRFAIAACCRRAEKITPIAFAPATLEKPASAAKPKVMLVEGNEAAALGVALARPTWSPCIRSRRSPRWSRQSPS